MKPGQLLQSWWQNYVLGRLTTPQSIFKASRLEILSATPSERFLQEPLDGPTWDVPERLRSKAHFYTQGQLNQWDRADYQQTDRRLLRWAAVFTELCRLRGIPVYTHSAFRTKAQQDKAVADGASKTPYPRSAHNIGCAVDIVHGVYHWALTPKEWAFLHLIGRRALDLVNADLIKADKLALNWGGDEGPGDTFRWDPAHWEITDYRNRIAVLPVGDPLRLTPRFILNSVKL